MPAQAKSNILIVDDSPSKLLAMTAALAELDQNLITAQSGREALRYLLQQEFAVILLDVNMPEMGGFETAALIRERKSTARVPIIFVTAYGDDTYAAQGYSLGAVDYILTPVVPEVLRAKVGVFVELYQQHDQVKQQALQQIALAEERAARRTAEAANRMKDEFLATLSHELRTPLSAILGWAQLLRMTPPTEDDLASGLEVIERNARAQAKIIEDLLDVSRIISGKLQLDLRPANIIEIVEAAVSVVRPTADSKGVSLFCRFEPSVPRIEIDVTRMQQVIWNLLSNGVKFTPTGGTIRIGVRSVKDEIEISVSDTGDGIPADFLPFVFDRFRQADATTTRSHGGLGLGLAIVRQLVGMHAGSVSVASDGVGQGSTFTVRLPTVSPVASNRTVPQEGSVATDQEAQGVQLDGVRVLLVDDEKDSREMVERILSRLGAHVLMADSTPNALSRLSDFDAHIVVSDIGMPGMDGFSLIREIRRRRSPSQLPAIALTAYARPEERQRALDAGFQVHIAKPVNHAELTAAISRLVHPADDDCSSMGRYPSAIGRASE